MTSYYVGLAVSGHDPAFAIVDEAGQVLFAEATERFVKQKRAWGIAPDHPAHLQVALGRYCRDATRFVAATSWLRPKPPAEAKTGRSEGERNPLLDLATSNWLREHQREAFMTAGRQLADIVGDLPVELRHFDHHLCHAAYACDSSPFADADCLVLDGEGEVGAVSLYRMAGRSLTRVWRSWGPGSLGAYYAFLTSQCGFDWRAGEEWKVMGLAAFGTPDDAAKDALKRLVDIDRGRPRAAEPAVWRDVVDDLCDYRREPGEDIMRGARLAASGQAVYADLANRIIADAGIGSGSKLVLGGGCALNSSHNGSLQSHFGLSGIHVPPAPADDGNAIGAALLAWQQDHAGAGFPGSSKDPYLGSEPVSAPQAVAGNGFASISELAPGATMRVAELLAMGRIVGVMRGRAEFGPRALGNRSILADPRGEGMKDRLNREVKGREPYRPFAPVVAADEADEWFENPSHSPYMSFTSRWRPDRAKRVPAVVHADATGRLQTVSNATNPWLADLVRDLGSVTGTPVLLNTSLNVMGKPIAHDWEDALTILTTTGLDALVLDDLLIEK